MTTAPPRSLTSHLLSLDPPALEHATTHAFLVAAANGRLPHERLKHWLAQDRLYALSYTNFIGQLLALVPIPTGADREERVEWRVADCLIDCAENIRREMRLFESVARGEGWLEEVCGEGIVAERRTRSYQDLFAGSVAMGRGLVVGMTVLWATEECYLRAWRFARGNMAEANEAGDVMRRVFIPNWSSVEFEDFVKRLRGLVDELAVAWNVQQGRTWIECESAWRQVLWAETEFWPDVEV